ncbi:MAG: hypothetical protein WBM69_00390 [Desulfobacterales bacterium]
MRFNLILFALVLVNQFFIEDEYDDECGTCRAVAQRAKTTHLTFVIRLLYSDTH